MTEVDDFLPFPCRRPLLLLFVLVAVFWSTLGPSCGLEEAMSDGDAGAGDDTPPVGAR